MKTKQLSKSLLLVFFFLTGHVYPSKIDSLIQSVKTTNNDSLKITTYLQIADILEMEQYDSAKMYFDEAMFLAKKNIKNAGSKAGVVNFKALLAKTHNDYGVFYSNHGELDSAVKYLEQSLKILHELKDDSDYIEEIYRLRLIANANNNLGIVYDHKALYDKSIEYYLDALSIFDKLSSAKDIDTRNYAMKGAGIISNNIGLLYERAENFDKASEYYSEGKKYFKRMTEQQDRSTVFIGYLGLGNIHNNLGILLKEKKNYNKALEHYKKAIQNFDTLDKRFGRDFKTKKAMTYGNMGVLYGKLNKYDEAFKYFHKAMDIHQKNRDKRGIVIISNNLAETNFKLGNYTESIKHSKKSIEIAREAGLKDKIALAYRTLSDAYEKLGKHSLAFEYFKKFYHLNDSLANKEKINYINELEEKYQSEKKEQEIKLLKKEQELKNLQLAKKESTIKTRNLQLIIIVSLLVSIVLAGLLIYTRSRNKQKQQQKDRELNEKRLRLKTMIETQETERARIAKDIHDGLGQMISVAFMFFSKTLEQQFKKDKEVEKITEVLKEANREVRSVAHRMMPRALEEKGLVTAISDLLKNSFTHLNIKYHFDIYKSDINIDPKIEIGIYRICQELVNNIIKHADAKEVNIQLFRSGNELTLIVEDDGKGINKEELSPGVGLQNILARAEAISAEFEIYSAPVKGTVASLNVGIN